MENKTLVTFGDSWPQGSELLPNEKTFGELVANQLGCKQFKNYAYPASSINHLTVQLKNFLHMLSHSHIADSSDCIAIFFLTEPGRTFTVVDSSTVFLNPDGGFGLPRDKDLENTINKTIGNTYTVIPQAYLLQIVLCTIYKTCANIIVSAIITYKVGLSLNFGLKSSLIKYTNKVRSRVLI